MSQMWRPVSNQASPVGPPPTANGGGRGRGARAAPSKPSNSPPIVVPPDPQAVQRRARTDLNILLTPASIPSVIPDQNLWNPSDIIHEVNELFRSSGHKDRHPIAMRLLNKLIIEDPISIAPSEKEVLSKYPIHAYVNAAEVKSAHPNARIARAVVDKMLWELAVSQAERRNKRDFALGLEDPRQRIVDMFGSNRYIRKLNFYASLLAKNGFPTHIDFSWYRPIITAKDASAYIELLRDFPSVDPVDHDILLFQDIYSLPPERIIKIFEDSKAEVAYFATMIYSNVSQAGVCFEEAPYYRKGSEFIASASPEEPPWPPSPPNDMWLRQEGLRSVAWTLHRQVGDYYVFKMVRAPFEIKEAPIMDYFAHYRPVISHSLIEIRPFPVPVSYIDKFVTWCRSWFEEPPSHLYVAVKVAEKLAGAMVGKTRQPFQLSSLTSTVSSQLDAEEYAPLWEYLPPDHAFNKTRVLQDTVLYITWHSFEYDVRSTVRAADYFGLALDKFKALKNHLVPTHIPFLTKLWPLIAIGAILKLSFMLPVWLIKAATATSAGVIADPVSKIIYWCYRVARHYTRPIADKAVRSTLAVVQRYPSQFALCASLFIQVFDLDFQNAFVTHLIAFAEEKSKQRAGILAVLYQIFIEAATIYYTMPQEYIGFAHAMFAYKIIQHYLYYTYGPMFHVTGNTILFTLNGLFKPLQNWVAWMFSFSFNIIPDKVLYAIHLGIMIMATMAHLARIHLDSPDLRKAHFESLMTDNILNYAFHKLYLPYFTQTTAGTVFTHTDYVNHVVPPKLVAWHEAMQSSSQKFFESEAVLLTPEEAFVPGLIRCAVNHSPLPLDVYDMKLKPAGQFIIVSNPAMFQRPVGVFQFYHALNIRNRACAEFLQECELLGCTPWKTRCRVVGPCWTLAYKAMFPELRRRIRKADPAHSEKFDSWKMSRAEWINHFNASMQRERARQAVDKRSENIIYPKATIFLKSDEVLCPKMLDGGFMGLKSRLVKAVDPTIQAACCVSIDKAMKLLKTIWQDPFSFENGWQAYFSVGSGKNGEELGIWFTEKLDWVRLCPKRIAIIIAGDDTFFIANLNGELIFGEIDFSKYDRTQGIHALVFEMKVLHMFGMDKIVASYLLSAILSDAVYEDKSIQFSAKIKMPPQRATGGPDTTFGNTFHTAVTFFQYLYVYDNPDFTDIPRFQSLFGFESKYKSSSSFMGMTFLKGSWFPVGHKYIWLPLPSQAIKVGKILTNPLDIYKHCSPPEAWRKAAYSLAKGVGHIPRDYPILGDLLFFYLQVGIENDHKLKENQMRPETVEFEGCLDPDFVYAFLEARYSISLEEVQCFQEQLRLVWTWNPPFLLPSSSIWPKLWLDYE